MIDESVLTDIAAIPVISSGMFVRSENENFEFELNLSINKFQGELTKTSNYLWKSNNEAGSMGMNEIGSEIKFRSFSPDGSIFLVGIFNSNSNEMKNFIEVWVDWGTRFSSCINLTNVHGDFCIDEVFSSFNWNFDGTKFIYVAEKKSQANPNDFSKYLENENFGEKLQNIVEPVVCVLEVLKLKSRVLEFEFTEEINEIESNFNENKIKIYPAQPIFGNGNEIFFTGIKVGSRKLGMTYIYCRHSAIYCVNNNNNNNFEDDDKLLSAKIISDPKMSSRSPIISNDGNCVAYLRNSIGRSHFKTSQIVIYNKNSSETKVIVDIVKDPKASFPGIYCQRLPPQIFSDKIYLTTCWYDFKPLISVEISDGSILNLIPNFKGTFRILDILQNKEFKTLLVVGSTATCPGKIFLLNSKTLNLKEINVNPISHNKTLKIIQNELENSVIELNSNVHIVLLKPKILKSKFPLIIVPHGGPNSVYSVDYVLYPTILAKMGYAVASINFTGSTGFGDDSIEALEGQIGIRDVEDCYLALKLLLNSNEFDHEKVVVMGGSHGGYLTAFLSAKYPNLFCGAILRNPVIDLLSMTVTSDISDWTFGQLGISNFNQLKSRGFTSEEVKLFHERSPSKFADQVKCPTLVMLGAMDLRVPPAQGKYWANLLKANGVDCQVFLFPDANHGLETTESKRFGLLSIINFLQEKCHF